MNKKGQAAMEFLMTYGWAILVVIAAIAALAYFGVLDPANLLPERCAFPPGMDCIDRASITDVAGMGTDTVTFALRNNIGFAINITDVSSTGECEAASALMEPGTSGSIDEEIGSQDIDNNEVIRIQITCTNDISSGDRFEEDITVNYINSNSGLTNSALGEIRGRVA